MDSLRLPRSLIPLKFGGAQLLEAIPEARSVQTHSIQTHSIQAPTTVPDVAHTDSVVEQATEGLTERTLRSLQSMCRERGLPMKGSKHVLAQRLKEDTHM